MAKALADPVDVGSLAVRADEFVREHALVYAVADLPRLVESLVKPPAGDWGRVTAEFRFHTVDGQAAASVHVHASVWLVCQRCLNDYLQPIESESRVVFVPGDAESADVREDYEAFAAPHGRARLADLVEDECLLALPLVPMHASAAECVAQAETADEIAPPPADDVAKTEVQRPFADLRDLLKR